MTAIEHVCDILQSEMNLAEDQVYLYEQKIKLPPDSRLYIAVGVSSVKPFGNSSYLVPDGGGLSELLSINVATTLMIDILSRSKEALHRKEEVLLALKSQYAQSKQETYSFYIAPLSIGFVNLSELTGSAIPYRFNISVNMQYFISKQKQVDYYDQFTDSLITES